MKWLPIESAPRDGRPVWVKDAAQSCGWAYWREGYTEDWLWAGSAADVEYFLTHWMPLPPPPEADNDH